MIKFKWHKIGRSWVGELPGCKLHAVINERGNKKQGYTYTVRGVFGVTSFVDQSSNLKEMMQRATARANKHANDLFAVWR